MDNPNYPDPLRHLDKPTILIILIDILSIRMILDFPCDYFGYPIDYSDSIGDFTNYCGDYFDPPGNYPKS